jgi:hypothetical protein
MFTEGLMNFPKVVPLAMRLTLAGVVMLTAGESATVNVWVCADASGRPSRIRTSSARILKSLEMFRAGDTSRMQWRNDMKCFPLGDKRFLDSGSRFWIREYLIFEIS